MEQFTAWLGREGLTPHNVLGTLFMLITASVVALSLGRVLRRMLPEIEARLHLPYETALTLVRMLSGTVWVVAILLVLNFWGASVNGLWAILVSGLTIVGVGFLAVWTMVSNVTASLFIVSMHNDESVFEFLEHHEKHRHPMKDS
jgi:small-conductance mechanosensitive channel